jgi:hypothetical protein
VIVGVLAGVYLTLEAPTIDADLVTLEIDDFAVKSDSVTLTASLQLAIDNPNILGATVFTADVDVWHGHFVNNEHGAHPDAAYVVFILMFVVCLFFSDLGGVIVSGCISSACLLDPPLAYGVQVCSQFKLSSHCVCTGTWERVLWPISPV